MKQKLEKNQTYRKKEGRAGEEKRPRLTQKAIVEVAAELFARHGFGATSLDDIAQVLGVTKPALYYHVKNKEEILRLICLLILNVAEEPLQQIVESDLPPIEKLQHAIEQHIAVAANKSPALTVFYHEQQHLSGPFAKEIALRMKDYEHYFLRIIEEGQAKGAFKSIDARIITLGLLGMCHWVSQWYKHTGRYTHQEVAQIFTEMVAHGLIPSPPD